MVGGFGDSGGKPGKADYGSFYKASTQLQRSKQLLGKGALTIPAVQKRVLTQVEPVKTPSDCVESSKCVTLPVLQWVFDDASDFESSVLLQVTPHSHSWLLLITSTKKTLVHQIGVCFNHLVCHGFPFQGQQVCVCVRVLYVLVVYVCTIVYLNRGQMKMPVFVSYHHVAWFFETCAC